MFWFRQKELTGRKVTRSEIWTMIFNTWPHIDPENVRLKHSHYIIPDKPYDLLRIPSTWKLDLSKYEQPCVVAVKHYMGQLAQEYGDWAVFRIITDCHHLVACACKTSFILWEPQTGKQVTKHKPVWIDD